MLQRNIMTQYSIPSASEKCTSGPDIWWVYMVRCSDQSLYVGVARCLERRLRQHNGELAGGARYTLGRRPVVIAWQRPAPSRSEAQALEARLKKLSRREKLNLIADVHDLDGGCP